MKNETQTKTKHTQGDWKARIIDDSKQIVGTKDDTVAMIYRNLGSPVTQEMYGQGDANARLIASAPLLLKALKEIASGDYMTRNWKCNERFNHEDVIIAYQNLADDAIKLAEGEN